MAFKPSLSLRLLGGLGRNGHPALRASVRASGWQARIATAAFTLPPGELLDLHHVRDVCARRLPPERCPAGSRLGEVRLWSQLLGAPLAGPIYLREPAKGLPDLLADLRSGGVRILLFGSVTAPGRRLRVRFGEVPDLPISRAVISLTGGRRGILVNSETLCGRSLPAGAAVSSHSGKVRRLRLGLRLEGRC